MSFNLQSFVMMNREKNRIFMQYNCSILKCVGLQSNAILPLNGTIIMQILFNVHWLEFNLILAAAGVRGAKGAFEFTFAYLNIRTKKEDLSLTSLQANEPLLLSNFLTKWYANLIYELLENAKKRLRESPYNSCVFTADATADFRLCFE